jgi:hypothetical protein
MAEQIEAMLEKKVGASHDITTVVGQSLGKRRERAGIVDAGKESMWGQFAYHPQGAYRIREFRCVLGEHHFRIGGPPDRGDPIEPLRGLLPAAVRDLHPRHPADAPQATAIPLRAAVTVSPRDGAARTAWKRPER